MATNDPFADLPIANATPAQELVVPTEQSVRDMIDDIDRKFDIEDMNANLVAFATEWLRAYEGDFSFLLDVQRHLVHKGKLSPAQAKGVLNCFRAEHLRRPTVSKTPLYSSQPAMERVEITEGFWTTANGSVVWKVQRAVHGSGNLYAKVLDEDGQFEYVSGGIRKLAQADAERLTIERAKELGHLYGRCMVCGRTLTDEGSIEAGIGPVCASKF